VAQTNQAFRILRALYNWARANSKRDGRPTIPENPVSILSELGEWGSIPPRSNRIPTLKIGAAWNHLQKMRGDAGLTNATKTIADFVAFLLLTGSRKGEAATLTWEQVNLEEGTWRLPDPKNRQPVVFPLSEQALEILKGRSRKEHYVFTGRSKKGHVVDCRDVLSKVSAAIGKDFTAHDLRRTFRAVAGECGIELWKTKLLMGHKMSGDVTITHYTETNDLTYLQPEAQAIADWIERQGKIAAAGNVVDLTTRRNAG
jgi:integrase